MNRTVTQNISLLLNPNEQLLGRNLGENGTGIRKMISTTQVPLVSVTTVTPPSVRIPLVKTPSDGKTKPEIPLNMSDYEESMELPNVDIDDNEVNQTLRRHNISVVKNVSVLKLLTGRYYRRSKVLTC